MERYLFFASPVMSWICLRKDSDTLCWANIAGWKINPWLIVHTGEKEKTIFQPARLVYANPDPTYYVPIDPFLMFRGKSHDVHVPKIGELLCLYIVKTTAIGLNDLDLFKVFVYFRL